MGLFMNVIRAIKGLFGEIDKELKPLLAEVKVIANKFERCDRPYNHHLAHRKGKSQRRNWKHWKGRS